MNKYINIYIDDYSKSQLQTKYMLKGIDEVAYSKKMRSRIFYTLDSLLKKVGSEQGKKIVIIFAESKSKTEDVLESLSRANIHPIFINSLFPNSTFSYSSIILNYHDAVFDLVSMILKEHPFPIALLGHHEDSFTDQMRLEGFLDAVEEYKCP